MLFSASRDNSDAKKWLNELANLQGTDESDLLGPSPHFLQVDGMDTHLETIFQLCMVFGCAMLVKTADNFT